MQYTIEDLVDIQNEIHRYSTLEFEDLRENVILKKAAWYERQALEYGDLTVEEGRWKIFFSIGMAKELKLFANMKAALEEKERIIHRHLDEQSASKQPVPGRRSINVPL